MSQRQIRLQIEGLKKFLKNASMSDLQKLSLQGEGMLFVSCFEIERDDETLQKILGNKKYKVEITIKEVTNFGIQD